MTTIMRLFFPILSLLSVQYFSVDGNQQNCMHVFEQMMKISHELLDEGEAPKCVYQYGLDQFKSNGLSAEERAKTMKAMAEFVLPKDAAEKKEIKNCFDAVRTKSFEKYEAENNEPVEEECVQFIKGIAEKAYEQMGFIEKNKKEL